MARFRLDNWKRWRGNCYEAAFAFQSRHPKAMLVHGMPVGRGKENAGQRFGHAWCEMDGQVYDITLPGGTRGMHPLLYYALGDLVYEKHTWRYDRERACVMALRFGHYGPWEGPEAEPPLRSQPTRKARRKGRKASPV
jgi:hypothetical protein